MVQCIKKFAHIVICFARNLVGQDIKYLVTDVCKCFLGQAFARGINRLDGRNFIGVLHFFDKVRMIYRRTPTAFQFSTDHTPITNRQFFQPIIQKVHIKKLNHHRVSHFISTQNLCRATTSAKNAPRPVRFYQQRYCYHIARDGIQNVFGNITRANICRRMQHKIQHTTPAQYIVKPCG